MADAPTLDFTCSQCGSMETYQLVSMEGGGSAPPSGDQTPQLDFTCSSCGASETFQLVPARAHA
jgi:predicted nucleic-acid-binding Zn-ribbon protein